MAFETYFRASSYAMIGVAMAALVLAGAVPVSLAIIFSGVMILAWRIEGKKWQLSERTGLILVLLAVPIFYADWSYQSHVAPVPGELQTNALVSAIAHLIIFLSAIKLLQVKSDRDWVFIYLISFFEVLLAAGFSLSPVFLGSLSVYLVCAVSTIIAFEIYKAKRRLAPVETRLLVPHDPLLLKLARRTGSVRSKEIGRLPIISVVFLVLILLLALPLFLVAPRAGAAAFTRGGGGLTNFVGFSENVQLGEIGTLKESDQIVMHVRVEESSNGVSHELKWRGVALDEFTGTGWKKSLEARRFVQKAPERGFFQLGTTEALHRLTTQTVFIEPLDTPVVFAAPRVIALQGPFPYLRVELDGSLQSRRHEFERLIYKAVSDTKEPDPAVLRRDPLVYPPSFKIYQQLPEFRDTRIEDLTRAMIVNEHARNGYDIAKAIESQLRSDYGYTLEMKASGPEPLTDFLFNVRAGHCEYFSTAMVVMLRTQHIAARVVNGFLSGEYNDAAGAYTVRQSDAHSWVEVYFPVTNSWVTFDPTPAAGRTGPQHAGLAGWVGKYAEAFELLWFQYVVGYDKQEQRSLATSLNNRLFSYRRSIATGLSAIRKAPAVLWQRLAFGSLAVVFAVVAFFFTRRIWRFGWRRGLNVARSKSAVGPSAVEFYERLTRLLKARGISRGPDQTPLEFATSLGWKEVLRITEMYNRVRFGGQDLSAAEIHNLEEALSNLQRDSK
jgi:transglutaminase-like putative cysteine protease